MSESKTADNWRRFSFFDVLPIVDPGSTPIYSDNQVTSIATGAKTLYLGTRSGTIRAVTKELEILSNWPAHTEGSVDFLFAHPTLNILISVSHIQGKSTEAIVWNTAKQPFKLVSSTHVTNGSNTYPLTAFSCSKDANVLAFGYGDGAVVVVRGDLVHDRGSRQRTVCNLSSPVTGLHIVREELFVVTVQQVLITSTTGSRTQKILEKSKGADLGCSSFDEESQQLVVCRDDDITFYHSDHRGATREFQVRKSQVLCFKHYLVMVTVHEMLNTAVHRLLIVDTLNDLVAYDGQVSLNVRHIFEQWGQLYIIGAGATGDSILYSLQETPIMQRLNLLKGQQLYSTAIKLAENAHCDAKVIMSLSQDYGDFLDENGDSDLALKNYIDAIDLGNTSHVIMRYKNSTKVSILAKYLEELESRGLASPAHLTLLLVCYTNMKDDVKLQNFVRRAVQHPKFEFGKAIDICRKSNFPKVGAFIAEKWPDPDMVVQIQLRDLQDYKSCLDYIHTISVSDALWVLVQNSRVLLNKMPVETTSLLITLFTGKFIQRSPSLESAANSLQEPESTPLLQSYQAFINYISLSKSHHIDRAALLESQDQQVNYQPPRPVLIFPSFIGHDFEFVIFLEACLENADQFQPSKKDLSDIVTTLYQVYLSLASGSVDMCEKEVSVKELVEKEPTDWKSKAQGLITNHGDLLDLSTVLMVTELKSIKLDSEQMKKLGIPSADILRDLISRNKLAQGVKVLDSTLETGSNHEKSECLQLVLRTLTTNKDLFDHLRPRFNELFEKCISLNVFSTSQLVKLSCSSPHMTVGDMRPFLTEQISRSKAQVDASNKIAASYAQDIEEKQKQIDALENKPLTIDSSTCSLCSMALDLPAIHFKCMHSYHKRCLGDSLKCLVCKPAIESIDAIRAAELQESAKTQLFFDSLNKTNDQLKVISDFISKGALMSS